MNNKQLRNRMLCLRDKAYELRCSIKTLTPQDLGAAFNRGLAVDISNLSCEYEKIINGESW